METFGPILLQGLTGPSLVGPQHALLEEHTYHVSARLFVFEQVTTTLGLVQVNLVLLGICSAFVLYIEDSVAGRCHLIVRSSGDLDLNAEVVVGIFGKKVSLPDPLVQFGLSFEELLSLPLQDLVQHAVRTVPAQTRR